MSIANSKRYRYRFRFIGLYKVFIERLLESDEHIIDTFDTFSSPSFNTLAANTESLLIVKLFYQSDGMVSKSSNSSVPAQSARPN